MEEKKKICYKTKLLKNGQLKKYNQSLYNERYYKKHKERLMEKKICELCGGSYSHSNISQHLKTLKHQEKAGTTLFKTISIKCDCGGKYTKSNKTIHEKTKRHIEHIKKQSNKVDL